MATFNITDAEVATLIARFDLTQIDNIQADDYENFGLMNSKIYREKFLRIATAAGLSQSEATHVIILFTAIKNKKRVLENISKFARSAWYNKVNNFIKTRMVQYTYEAGNDTYAAVHVPSAFPFIAARVWLNICKNPTIDSFLENLWSSQIHLDQQLIARAEVWETNFWTQTVKKGGTNFESGGFNKNYFDTKAADTYPLLLKDGTISPAANATGYTEAEINTWFGTK